jgi:peptide/nickel transport system permease protein
LTVRYLVQRLGVFLLIIWITGTLNFVLPRIGPGDPIEAAMNRLARSGVYVEGREDMVRQYRIIFGLDQPLPIQYLKYMSNMLRLDFGRSLSYFPTFVSDIIARAMPYTLSLVGFSVLLSFIIGTLGGALLSWRGTPRAVNWLTTLFVALAPIPYYLLAMVLLFVFAFRLKILPSGGTSTFGQAQTAVFSSTLDFLKHAILPALSIVLSSIGGWALGMRGMMATVQGEDYLTLAKAKGLRKTSIFLRYAVRNAILPQVTHLAISMGFVVSGATLVEMIFGYPGMGYNLYLSITNSDYTVFQGITFVLTSSVALAILIIDLLYPLLDPRITYGRK